MPKIRIREQDTTSGSTQYSNENVVFLVSKTETPLEEPVLIESTKDLEKYDKAEDIKSIIDLGGKVIVANSYKDAEDYLNDRNQFSVKFLLVDPLQEVGDDDTDDKTDLEYALNIARYRRDCCVIYSATASEFTDEEKALLNDAVGNSGDTSSDGFLSSETPSSVGKYCLAFYGNALINSNTKEAIRPGLAYILAFLKSVNEGNAEWLAVAGSKRGALPIDASAGFMTESAIDGMQPRYPATGETTSYAINPIIKMNPWGVRIWGNRTSLGITSDGLKASHFANIRILICDLKKQLYKAARAYQFEQNNDVLWVNFTSYVNTLLEQMKQSYGIAGYKWIREETTERAKLKATLRIIPIEAIEDFDLTINLTDSLDVEEA